MCMQYDKKKRSTTKEFLVNSTVSVSIPKQDRSGIDLPRLPCRVIEVKGKSPSTLYRLQTLHGILGRMYRAGDLMPYDGEVSLLTDPPKITMREACRLFNGKKLAKTHCNCKQCNSKCPCRQNNISCTTGCHASRTCVNKKDKQETLTPLQVYMEEIGKEELLNILREVQKANTEIPTNPQQYFHAKEWSSSVSLVSDMLDVTSDAEQDECTTSLIKLYPLKLTPQEKVNICQLAAAVVLLGYKTGQRPFHLVQTINPIPAHLAELNVSEEPSSEQLSVANTSLSKLDLKTLHGHSWLNDKVVHGYLGLLAQQSAWKGAPVFVLPCFLALLWEDGQYDRWLYKKVILRNFDYILLPACVNHHWILVVISVKQQTVDILDSMPNEQRRLRFQQHWQKFMSVRGHAVAQDLTSDGWQAGNLVSNRQAGSDDCGVFVLMNAESMLANIPVAVMRQCHCQMFRKYSHQRLLQHGRPREKNMCDMPFCSKPDLADWVQCEKCHSWCHFDCAGLEMTRAEVSAEDVHFVCVVCKD